MVPGAVGDLELVITGGNGVEELLIEALGVQGHLVAGIAAVPVALAKGSGTGHVVGGVFGEDGHGNAAQDHDQDQQQADALFHVVSSSNLKILCKRLRNRLRSAYIIRTTACACK